MKYVKKPVVVDALQWLGTAESFNQITSEFPDMRWLPGPMGQRQFVVENSQGNLVASCGDYIIRGVDGEYYSCSEGVFNRTYDAVLERNTEGVTGALGINDSGLASCTGCLDGQE
jgi:hypothetical protein